MTETHETTFPDEFDLRVAVDEDGKVEIAMWPKPHVPKRIVMDFDTFREVIDFVCKHGLDMKEPMIVEASETKEAYQAVLAR